MKSEVLKQKHKVPETLLLSQGNVMKDLLDISEFVDIDIIAIQQYLKYDIKHFFIKDDSKQAENLDLLESMKIY